MAQLEAMGFPTIRCQKALLATGNSDAETAMQWLFEHMEDPGGFHQAEMSAEELKPPDIDAPIQASGSGAASAGPFDEQIAMIADMGFSHNQARKALRQAVSPVGR